MKLNLRYSTYRELNGVHDPSRNTEDAPNQESATPTLSDSFIYK